MRCSTLAALGRRGLPRWLGRRLLGGLCLGPDRLEFGALELGLGFVLVLGPGPHWREEAEGFGVEVEPEEPDIEQQAQD